MGKHVLKCLQCGQEYEDDCLRLDCENQHAPAFLRTVYTKKKIEVGDDSLGFYKFQDWLPINRTLEGSSAPVTFKSERLNDRMGLTNLYITFNGYWPERGVKMTTGTFKECEAYSVCARLPEDFDQVLVVASAGNTARAFAKVCSENNIRLLLVVPERNLEALWFEKELNPCVKLLAAGGEADYFDAISLSCLACKVDGFIAEGGAKNVARRDGMATTVLSAITSIGRIPDFYFQAVGSGTGAIAAWEANMRFIESGDYGNKKMKLMLSQNDPFLLIHDSWKRGTRELVELDERDAKMQLSSIDAKVLSNRRPPYGIIGGLYDALKDTNGEMLGVTNRDAQAASVWFREAEGVDISPAAAVAMSSLLKAIREELVDPDATIMLNITGGGMGRMKKDKKMVYLKPHRVIKPVDFSVENVEKEITDLF